MTSGSPAPAPAAGEPDTPSHELFMRRPMLDDFPGPPHLPAGYELRPSRTGDGIALGALLARAFDDPTWNEQRVREVLTEAADVETVFVIAHAGGIVATASAQVPDRAAPVGWVHWVAADPDHQGTSLGTHVCLAVLHRLRELGLPDARLQTQDFRLPAIRAYLRLGFIPEYHDEDEQRRWSRVLPQLLPPRNRTLG